VPYWQGESLIAIHLESVLQRRAAELMGIQQAKALLDQLETTHPDLVAELVPKRVPMDLLSEILSRLLDEGICIRNLADILESLAKWLRSEKDPVLLTEYVRIGLKRQISHAYSGRQGFLPAFLLDPMVERAFLESIHTSESGSYLAMDPDLSGEILRGMKQALDPALQMGTLPVVLTRMEIRRYVRKMVEMDLPQVAVLSFQELDPSVDIRPVGQIGPGGPAGPAGPGTASPGGAGPYQGGTDEFTGSMETSSSIPVAVP